MSVHGQVRALLAGLGNTADEVAASLQELSVVGLVNDPCDCPIAMLIKHRFPQVDVHVGNEDVCLERLQHGEEVCYTTCEACNILLPTPVKEFIARFDRDNGRAYPGLLRYPDLAR